MRVELTDSLPMATVIGVEALSDSRRACRLNPMNWPREMHTIDIAASASVIPGLPKTRPQKLLKRGLGFGSLDYLSPIYH